MSTDAADQELRDIATIMRIIRRHSVEVRGRIMHYCAQRADEFDDDGNLKFGSGVPTMPKLHRPNDELTDDDLSEPTDE